MEEHFGRVDKYRGGFRGESHCSEIIQDGLFSIGELGGGISVGRYVTAEEHTSALDEHAVARKHFLPLLHHSVKPRVMHLSLVARVLVLDEAEHLLIDHKTYHALKLTFKIRAKQR